MTLPLFTPVMAHYYEVSDYIAIAIQLASYTGSRGKLAPVL